MLDAERRFEAAELYFGHGVDNARDDAVLLVFHALELAFDADDAVLDESVTAAQRDCVEALVARRIATRLPSAYLINTMWFAGHRFYVDERVLVPRSPLAELIDARFAPWVRPQTVAKILDIGTGSGCIAIACAKAFPGAQVTATDISTDALTVAAVNVARHDLEHRVHLRKADLFPAEHEQYDLIVANPPYVSGCEMAQLPPEYRHEPVVALRAGEHGLQYIRTIFARIATYLTSQGALFIDTGATFATVLEAFPGLPLIALELHNGGDGIFVLLGEGMAHDAGAL